ncbi:MAG: hypothetical protein ACYDHH_32795, partial [Solirubrobacteraceae bacterium]
RHLIARWSPQVHRIQLDRWLWTESPHVKLKQVAEQIGTYPYLPRLRDSNVLLDAVRDGVRSRDYFGYATGVADGRYVGLSFGTSASAIYLDAESVLVKPELAAEQAAQQPAVVQPPSSPRTEVAGRELPRRATRFHGTVDLNPDRAGLDASKIANEVVSHLAALLGADVKVTLDIQATQKSSGFPTETIRTVIENTRALKFKDAGFEEE